MRKMGLEKTLVLGIFVGFAAVGVSGYHDYRDALSKSLIFFEGQRSGKLPPGQNLKWRTDSGLTDGLTENVDLTGGYYDAGDNVKFGFPMAFTTTMLAWSVLEFGIWMPRELDHAREAVRWGTDYLLKACSALPEALYVQGYLVEKNEAASVFKEQAERFVCSVLPDSSSRSVNYTPGGLLYKLNGSNLQYVTSASFLLSVYAKYLKISKQTFSCGDMVVTPSILRKVVQKQVDYILGDNPRGLSYMVGFGNNFPQRVHHRGSSISSILSDSQNIGCNQGFQFYYATNANPNVLIGAVVGGPDQNDEFSDDRSNYAQSEPATYINAPLVGTLSYLAACFRP